jgi:hypothetical protein
MPPALFGLVVWMFLRIRRQLRSRSARVLLYPVLAVLMAASVAGGCETVRESLDAKAYPMPGQLIDVGGHRLHLYCTGSGSPTVATLSTNSLHRHANATHESLIDDETDAAAASQSNPRRRSCRADLETARLARSVECDSVDVCGRRREEAVRTLHPSRWPGRCAGRNASLPILRRWASEEPSQPAPGDGSNVPGNGSASRATLKM